jgi:hypothetical protein
MKAALETSFVFEEYIEHGPYEANGRSASRNIPRLSFNPKIYYRLQKYSNSVPSQLNLVHPLTYTLFLND